MGIKGRFAEGGKTLELCDLNLHPPLSGNLKTSSFLISPSPQVPHFQQCNAIVMKDYLWNVACSPQGRLQNSLFGTSTAVAY
jgi:hypothetical protein